MNCSQCSHPYEQHRIGTELRCCTRIAYGWDEGSKTFAGAAPCRCTGYRGAIPGNDCPHEYVKESVKCVHCGHVLASGEKKAT